MRILIKFLVCLGFFLQSLSITIRLTTYFTAEGVLACYHYYRMDLEIFFTSRNVFSFSVFTILFLENFICAGLCDVIYRSCV